MKSKMFQLPLLAFTAGLAMACTNPTIDPESTFYAEGRAVTADGDPLVGAEVKVVRYFHPAKLLRPDVDDLFDCDAVDCGYPGLDLEVGLVSKTTTDMEGRFSMDFKGADIAGQSGVMDDMGLVEGSNVVIVVKDPNDMLGNAGVFTNDYTYQQTDKTWDPGELNLWNANAVADVSNAGMSGNVNFAWNRSTAAGTASVDTTYRVEVRGGGSRLVQRCFDGENSTLGGCNEEAMSDRLSLDVSAFSLYTFYSDMGNFAAYVQGNGREMNWRTAFTVQGVFENPAMNREPIMTSGVWAITESGAEAIDGSAATDGLPSTRLSLMSPAQAVYVELPLGSLVTDAGLLNSVVSNSYSACIVLEFSSRAYDSVGSAQMSGDGDWVQEGRFCGGNGGSDEVSALVSFDTSASMGQVASWMRFRVENTQMSMVAPLITDIGEVAVYAAE